MAKFNKPFRGVPNGEIYGREFAQGDECPHELEQAAREAGALESKPAVKGKVAS